MQKNNRRTSARIMIALLLIIVLFAVACGPSTPAARLDESSSTEEPNQPSPTEEARVDSEDLEKDRAVAEDIPVSGGVTGLEVDPAKTEVDENGIIIGFTSDGHAFRGDPNAPVIIKEYSDFQCPFCSRFFKDTLPSIEQNQLASGEAVLVYYDFPLNNIHPQASPAANAARCAGEQSAAAFWAMHDALFAEPDQWSNQDAEMIFTSYAEEIGLDGKSFTNCISTNRYAENIQADLDSGFALGISGTPSFFINDQLLVGAQPLAIFDEAITVVKNGGQLASNEPQQPSPSQPQAAPTPTVLDAAYAGAMGDPDAPVTIVEFTDYQCPYCARHSQETMPSIISEFVDTGRVYYILKDLPLDNLHPGARPAAAAARCAGEQGFYWEMHDALFTDQEDWANAGEGINEKFVVYADDLGLDKADFSECINSGRLGEDVEANASEARSLGVNGTPFFFVNGYPLNGARPFEHFQIAVELAEQGRLAEAYAPPPESNQEPTGPIEVPVDDAISIGDADAPITIVEYTDFQCPFCSRHFQQTYPQILENYVDTGIVRYVFKDFPLNNIHPQAAEAAQAARCAGDQGAYTTMHDVLFARQSDWSNREPTDIFISYAEELGLDAETFAVCLTSEKYASAVEADLQEGVQFGVTGTPAFFINGYPLSGAQPYTIFEQAIESLLADLDG